VPSWISVATRKCASLHLRTGVGPPRGRLVPACVAPCRCRGEWPHTGGTPRSEASSALRCHLDEPCTRLPLSSPHRR
jgi:hypothetical protein